MCMLIEHPNLMAGWGCCHCHVYNGLHRDKCKACGKGHCDLKKDGERLEARQDVNV